MKVTSSYHIETVSDGSDTCEHHVEIGTSSWSDSVVSLRNRWDRNGRFNPHSSSELSVDDTMLMACVAVQEGLVDAETILALQSVINKQLYETAKPLVPAKKEATNG